MNLSDLHYPVSRHPHLAAFLNGLIVALCFSAFIYLEHWGWHLPLLDTLLGIAALLALLTISRKAVLWSGFFIGLLWFYWIGYSFEYYGMSWAIPLVSLGFGLVYLLIFGTLALTDRAWLRALLLLGISYFDPFHFNWMRPELLFVDSYIGVEKWQFALLLLTLVLILSCKGAYRYLAALLLVGTLDFTHKAAPPLPFSIELASTAVPQHLKWIPSNQTAQVNANLQRIDLAIANGKQLIILPESAFPLYMNHHSLLIKTLKEKSKAIAIVTGALLEENGQNYNVTYFFHHGEYSVAKKMVLVPFGEYIPLPSILSDWINELVFGGASDYHHADRPTDFVIDGATFRNAICYEATTEVIYENAPELIIAISNNGWFTPSIEPTLQRLLLRFYADKYDKTILHAANMAGTGIIHP